MLNNFQFLNGKKEFESFSSACIEAEKAIEISPSNCAMSCRRALELTIKWLYSFDRDLKLPYQDKLSSLIHAPSFRNVVDEELISLMKYIVKLGNASIHTNISISREEAIVSLHNLYQVVAWIDYCYADEYTATEFDESLVKQGEEKRTDKNELNTLYNTLASKDKEIQKIIKENEELRERLTNRRVDKEREYNFNVDKLSEAETRKIYIDLDLKLAGWKLKEDVLPEYPVDGMPNTSGKGSVDYVMLGDNGRPIALIEAKKTSYSVKKGIHQAKLYADCIEKKYNQRPVIFLSNGYDIELLDDYNNYPSRRVYGYFTKDQIQRMIDRRSNRKSLKAIEINDDISNRPYQKLAIHAVCNAFEEKQRKALLVMATGTGKTRTAISIVDVLSRNNWIKNVLFLADRTALVKQAKNNFSKLLPNLTLYNMLDKNDRKNDNPENCRMIFSTYKTMMNSIDEAKTKDGSKLFTPGHFDLIIVDESHRSIYKKFKSIFDYFDGFLLGLTATPREDLDKNTYEVFELENGVPTYAYDLDKAVKDGYLVPYSTIKTKTKFMEKGIKYSELSEEDRSAYEDTFDEDEDVGEEISSAAMNSWLFNIDTVDKILNEVMEKGLKVEGGDKLGKTIVFAKNHNHAEFIVERFNKIYPQYGSNFIALIDNYVDYADDLIDRFSDAKNMPQIAVSVDMLDTGIDIPEILNLVFFKKVRSKSKFWQMVGRGTRLCEDLLGIDKDKEKFLIFDYCGNFDFFEANENPIESGTTVSLTERIFNLKVSILKELQDLKYQEEPFIQHRKNLLKEVMESIKSLDEDSYIVNMNRKYVHKYKNKEIWNDLGPLSIDELKKNISPLIFNLGEEESARRFDNLVYTIESGVLEGLNVNAQKKTVIKMAEALSKKGTIPQILEKKDSIISAKSEDFWSSAGIIEIDEIRNDLRGLIKFLDKKERKPVYTNFEDEILEVVEGEPIYRTNDLTDYKKKVEHYLLTHKDEIAIHKLRNNKKLTKTDLDTLERILWNELGSKSDYENEFGDTPVMKLVRHIIGLDVKAAQEAFSEFLSDNSLDYYQMRFINMIVEHITINGFIEDKKVLTEDPFISVGRIVDLFEMSDIVKIRNIIDEINDNVESVI